MFIDLSCVNLQSQFKICKIQMNFTWYYFCEYSGRFLPVLLSWELRTRKRRQRGLVTHVLTAGGDNLVDNTRWSDNPAFRQQDRDTGQMARYEGKQVLNTILFKLKAVPFYLKWTGNELRAFHFPITAHKGFGLECHAKLWMFPRFPRFGQALLKTPGCCFWQVLRGRGSSATRQDTACAKSAVFSS